jgi:alpha-tubulin suppressor-like RCC1 family protein
VDFPAGVTIASIPTDADPWDTAYAIDTNGNVWGWGANAGSELCLNNTTTYLTPVELPFTNVTAVAGAAQHSTYAATFEGQAGLFSCGVGTDGQLGNGSHKSSHTPVQVKGLGGAPVSTVVTGYNDVGVLLTDGRYYDWGLNNKGQLGNGTAGGFTDTPAQVNLPGLVTQVAQGGNGPSDGQSLVILSDGSIYAWGVGSSGQLGTGKVESESSPVQIFPPSGVTYAVVAAGGETSYAVSTDGVVYGWGSNNAGQLGMPGHTSSKVPVVIVDQARPLISSTSNDVDVAMQQ